MRDRPNALSPCPSPPVGGDGARRAGEGDAGYPRPSDGRGAGREGLSAGRPYFVMELVRGIKITEYCDQNNLVTTERLNLFIQVCHAIQHAHQKGIIHRDIKPSNVLVTLHDGVPVPKVIDFGIAKATTDQRLTNKTLFTAFEQFIGTPAYMSPEQAEMSGLDIDTRSDIYSLGVLLYELLTGKTPFDANELLKAGLDEMRRIIREQEPARPSTRVSTLVGEELTTTARHRQTAPPKLVSLLRGDLDWIVMKCLEKDRTRRYETANGVALDLEHHLHSEPVVARPPSRLYRFQKLVRRNKLAFAAAASVACALAIGTVVSTWQAIRATRAVREQSRLRQEADTARTNEIVIRQRAEQERNAARRSAYAANMFLAQAAWDDSNIGLLRQVLAETADDPERGFEWYYWQRQCHLDLRTLRGHLGAVFAVAFSPDGQRIMTASEDKTAKVWEANTGRELLTLKGHTSYIRSGAFSPDGQLILTGSGDRTVKLWDSSSGREILILKGHTNQVASVAFSPDGQRMATSSNDHTAKVWESSTGRELFTLTGHTNWILSVAFSPDGQQIVTVGNDGMTKVWEANTGRELHTLQGMYWSAAFSPDGQRIATGIGDGTAKILEVATGREWISLTRHTGPVISVAFSADGQRLVTGSWDRTAKVWEAKTGRDLLTLKTHSNVISSLAFSPDARRFVTGSWDRTAKVWETSTGRELLTLKGHTEQITCVDFSPDGRRIVTGSFDRTVKIWEANTGRELLTLKGHKYYLCAAIFFPDAQRILTASQDRTALIWKAASQEQVVAWQEEERDAARSLEALQRQPDKEAQRPHTDPIQP
ncbi:MAG: protein kinase [Verrucomicrobia bacterium]|nr:protein kinase [Verrucomicrobiota bacterium]